MLNDQAGVLIIGNASKSFTAKEVQAVKNFVEGGGGLLVVGAGWAWQADNPKAAWDDDPVNQLLKEFGARWTGAKIETESLK